MITNEHDPPQNSYGNIWIFKNIINYFTHDVTMSLILSFNVFIHLWDLALLDLRGFIG